MTGRELPTGRLTFLFTDIEGSTRLSSSHGAEFAALIDRHHALIREALQTNDGDEVSTEGDAFFAVFTSPGSAARATVEAQRALAAEPWPSKLEVRVRMGLHTGEGQLGGDSYAGYDVNLAARVSGAGHGGQVVVSAATADAIADDLSDGVSLLELGDFRLKDIDGVVTLHQLRIDGLPAEFPPLRADRPGFLPAPATSFVGREDEADAIAAYSRVSRLVTLTGPGGTGKTRLAIEAARVASVHAPAGTWFVPFDAISDPDLVIPAIAAALDVRDEPDAPLDASVARAIGSRPRLLVLDNLEQVIDAAGTIAALIAAAPGLHVIATSREPLRVAGEQEVPIPALTPMAATALFAERARLVQPAFALDRATQPDVLLLVERLDRLPLAIELAAARSRMFGPAALLARLDDRLTLLASTARDVPERQRTLRGAIEWSVGLLDAGDRRGLVSLSVFHGSFDLPAAEACLDDDVVADLLVGSLVERSLVAVADSSGAEPRFRLLETIRGYAASERAMDPAYEAALLERHARHYLERAEERELRSRGGDLGSIAADAERDSDNTRAALTWAIDDGQPGIAARLAFAQWRFWQYRGHLREGRERLRTVLALPAVADEPSPHAMALRAMSGLSFWTGDLDTALETASLAVEVLTDTSDAVALAEARFDLGWTQLARGETAAARTSLEQSLSVFEAAGERHLVHRTRSALINVAMREGDWQTASVEYEPLLAEVRETGGPSEVAERFALGFIIAINREDVVAARVYASEAASQVDVGNARYATWIEGAAYLAVLEGRADLAARWIGAIERISEEGGGALLTSALLGMDSAESRARAVVGDAFEYEAAVGRRMTPDQAFHEVQDYLSADVTDG